jgi:hypothetical protein
MVRYIYEVEGNIKEEKMMKKEFMFQIDGEVKCILASVESVEILMDKLIKHFKTEDIIFLGVCEA